MAKLFHLRIQLLDVEPPPWREIVVHTDWTFHNLHLAIQDACGWEDCHLFAFRPSQDGPIVAGIPDDDFGVDIPDAEFTPIQPYLIESNKLYYQYDFGDDWWHEITLVDTVIRPRIRRALVGGERAFPPEDCGGIPGYEACVAVRRGEETPRAKDLVPWLGDWDPDRFDLEQAKADFDR